MKYVLSELLINELDQLEQLTSSLVNGNVSYDEVSEYDKTRKDIKTTSIQDLSNR